MSVGYNILRHIETANKMLGKVFLLPLSLLALATATPNWLKPPNLPYIHITPVTTASPLPSECYLKQEHGPCSGRLIKYYYEKRANKCLPFAYGGCAGNGNKFDSHEACETHCSDAPPPPSLPLIPQPQQLPNERVAIETNVCQQPPANTCQFFASWFPKTQHFYYNKEEKKCETTLACFSPNVLATNPMYRGQILNLFKTEAECMEKCVTEIPSMAVAEMTELDRTSTTEATPVQYHPVGAFGNNLWWRPYGCKLENLIIVLVCDF